MTTRQALVDFFADRDLCRGRVRSFEDCYREPWLYQKLGPWQVPVLPVRPFRKGIVLHDLHHVVTGYDTTWTGECEVAAWELASGGCGWRPFFWLDRLIFVLIGAALAPAATTRAFRRGLRHRNLYRLDPEPVLALELDELRRFVGV